MRRGAPEIPQVSAPLPGLNIVGAIKQESERDGGSPQDCSSRSNKSGNASSSQRLVPPEHMTDEDFDMKGTSRKEYENEYYKRICSEIIDDFLYLGRDFIAHDEELLK